MVLGTSRDSHDDLRLLHAQSGMERSYLVRFSLLGLTQGKHAVGLGSTNTADEPPADSKAMPSCLDSNALNLNTKWAVGLATFRLHSVRPAIFFQEDLSLVREQPCGVLAPKVVWGCTVVGRCEWQAWHIPASCKSCLYV